MASIQIHNHKKENRIVPWYTITDIDTVKEPAFLVPWSSSKCSWLPAQRPADKKLRLFVCIPYERVHRDACHDFVHFYKKQNRSKKKLEYDTLPVMLPDHQIDTINKQIHDYFSLETVEVSALQSSTMQSSNIVGDNDDDGDDIFDGSDDEI